MCLNEWFRAKDCCSCAIGIRTAWKLCLWPVNHLCLHDFFDSVLFTVKSVFIVTCVSMVFCCNFSEMFKFGSILFAVLFSASCKPSNSVGIVFLQLTINIIESFTEKLDWWCSVREVFLKRTSVHLVETKAKHTIMLSAENCNVCHIKSSSSSCTIIVWVYDWDSSCTAFVDWFLPTCWITVYVASVCSLELLKFQWSVP